MLSRNQLIIAEENPTLLCKPIMQEMEDDSMPVGHKDFTCVTQLGLDLLYFGNRDMEQYPTQIISPFEDFVEYPISPA